MEGLEDVEDDDVEDVEDEKSVKNYVNPDVIQTGKLCYQIYIDYVQI